MNLGVTFLGVDALMLMIGIASTFNALGVTSFLGYMRTNEMNLKDSTVT
jgi:hypothetical protein